METRFKAAAYLIPKTIMEKEGYDKFLKVVCGTLLYKLEALCSGNECLNFSKIPDELFKSIQTGYYFGLTYPLIDDLLDSPQVLDSSGKRAIRAAVINALLGKEIKQSELPNIYLVQDLKTLFSEFSNLLPREQNSELYTALQVLAIAQSIDQEHFFGEKIDHTSLVYPALLKAAYSRIIPSLLSGKISQSRENHYYATALINQWSDDIIDIKEDLESGSITTMNYRLTGVKELEKSKSPIELYFGLIYHITNQFENPDIKDLLLKRAIQAFAQLSQKTSAVEFNAILNKIGFQDHPSFKSLLLELINKTNGPNIERALFRQASTTILNHLKYDPLSSLQKDPFKKYRDLINSDLLLKISDSSEIHQHLIEAMNYSLDGSG
ncbi:MAG: hypothetical protein JSS09_09745, partial [Verrucomicrobia bacterium]|nr:hypothetical protein [Verrucomicrobiota bacterium]